MKKINIKKQNKKKGDANKNMKSARRRKGGGRREMGTGTEAGKTSKERGGKGKGNPLFYCAQEKQQQNKRKEKK